MKIYKSLVDVRWNDLDANAHLANASYINFTSHARVEVLKDEGIGMLQMKQWGYGPVIFSEQIQYFREIMPHACITIHTQCTGTSENLVLFEFEQKLYGQDGTHHATSRVFGGWIDMETRSLVKVFKPEMSAILKKFRSSEARDLRFSDLKNLPFKPQNISPNQL